MNEQVTTSTEAANTYTPGTLTIDTLLALKARFKTKTPATLVIGNRENAQACLGDLSQFGLNVELGHYMPPEMGVILSAERQILGFFNFTDKTAHLLQEGWGKKLGLDS